MVEPFKPILCLDFDGVCHSYTSGWQGVGVISDAPVSGLFDFLVSAKEHFKIHIFSSRSSSREGRIAMSRWFADHYTAYLSAKDRTYPNFLNFPESKPQAFLSIDDRGLSFNGVFPSVESLLAFQPWWKKGKLIEPVKQ